METTKTTTSDEVMIDVVNSETGELESVLASSLPKNKLLFHLGRAASNIRREVAQAKWQRDMKAADDKAIFENFKEVAESKIDTMNNMAADALKVEADAGNMPLDKKNRPYYNIPGRGKWAYRTGTAALVDTGHWDEMDEHEQADVVQTAPEGTYKTTVEYKPVKAEIRKIIKSGNEVRGWMLTVATDKLSFTDEK